MLTEQDKADLSQAQELIHGVLDRHDRDITLPVISLLTQAANDVRISVRYLATT